MAQASATHTTTRPPRARQIAGAELQVMNIKFDWSDQDWVMAFLPGTDTAVILLHHDRKDLERVVAGLSAFRERARFARDCDYDGPDARNENCR
jgi:hypothetical protein